MVRGSRLIPFGSQPHTHTPVWCDSDFGPAVHRTRLRCSGHASAEHPATVGLPGLMGLRPSCGRARGRRARAARVELALFRRDKIALPRAADGRGARGSRVGLRHQDVPSPCLSASSRGCDKQTDGAAGTKGPMGLHAMLTPNGALFKKRKTSDESSPTPTVAFV